MIKDFGWILSRNDQYLVLFGGYDCRHGFSNRNSNIFILDLNDMKFYKSSIKLSKGGRKRAITTSMNYNVLIFGYIRNISKEYKMNIPQDLFKIFDSYFDSEMVYLLDSQHKL